MVTDYIKCCLGSTNGLITRGRLMAKPLRFEIQITVSAKLNISDDKNSITLDFKLNRA